LPLWDAGEAERAHVLDVVLGAAGYRSLELHIESAAESVRAGSPILDTSVTRRLAAIAGAVTTRGGRLMLGLGTRHLLGPVKHEPSLICNDADGRALRLQLLEESIDRAGDLGIGILVFLSGPSRAALDPDKYQTRAWQHLEAGLERLLVRAEKKRVVLAPEAHSAHLFATIADVYRLRERFSSPSMGFTADTAHQTVTEKRPLQELYRELAPFVTHVQLDNLAARPSAGATLDKVPLDQPGAVDLEGAVAGLYAGGYTGTISVELLRFDHPQLDLLAYCRRMGEWMRRRLLARPPRPPQRKGESA
jgi:sugar phosphate isomerase/epimerase